MRATRSAMVLAIATVAGVTGWSLGAAPTVSWAAGTATSQPRPVELGAISGAVLDSAGKPVAGAKVLLFHRQHHPATTQGSTTPPTTQPVPHPHRQTVTDASGHFSFDKVHPGMHLLVAYKAGSGRGHVRDALKAGASDTVTITLHTPSK